MKGYADGTFHPNQPLTRAEAVVLFNRLTGRGPVAGKLQQVWTDVPVSHWAFSDITEATVPHEAVKQTDGTEVIEKQ